MRHWTRRGFTLAEITLPDGKIEAFTTTLIDGSMLAICSTDSGKHGDAQWTRAPRHTKEPVLIAHYRNTFTFEALTRPGQGFPVFPDSTTALHAAIGIAFATTVKEWLSESEWNSMLVQNFQHGDPMVCASHDHCDPNQAMIDVLEQFHFRDVVGAEESTPAWNYAKRTYFTDDAGVLNNPTPHSMRPLAPRTEVPLGETPALVKQLAAALDDLKTLFEAIDDDRHLQESPEWKRAEAALEHHRRYLNAAKVPA